MKTINLFFDFEFTSLSPDAQPISLGIVADNDKSFYSEFSDFDINRCDDWVKENVVSKLRFNNEAWGKNAFEESPTEMGSYHGSGMLPSAKMMLTKWLLQFSDDNIQFVCDCGTFDWYYLLQLIGEWGTFDFRAAGMKNCDPVKTGLPKLPDNISPVPQDLNDLIALKNGISVREAFDINREGMISVTESFELNLKSQDKHNSLYDAKVIKTIFNKLK